MKKPVRIMVVLDCTDYEMFDHLTGFNREVSSSNVKEKEKHLASRGFVGDIIVIKTSAFGKKDQLVVADGQHRIAALKLLKIPFDYKVYAFDKDDDTRLNVLQFISEYNSVAVNWSPEKYLDAFAANGSREYVMMKKMKKETGLTITDLQNVFLFGCGTNEVKAFKSGEMKFTNLRDSISLLSALMSIKDLLPNKAYTRRSMFKIFKMTGGEYQRFAEAVAFVIKKGKKEVPENEKMLFDFLKDVFKAEFSEKVKK